MSATRSTGTTGGAASTPSGGSSGLTGSIEIDGVKLRLSHPDTLELEWVGQDEAMDQLLAAWLVLGERDLPLNPRIIGKPGVGKTTLAYAAARRLEREAYVFQATMDTRPEDLLVTPVVGAAGGIEYSASPLVTAMIRGGVCILDEGNRMSEKSWASLAPLLDNRRYVESIVAGVKVRAHPDFRICATMNDDASTFEIPEYIHSRLMPQIFLDFPDADDELAILRANLPFVEEEMLHYVVAFLQRAHDAEAPFTVRDGINIARYAAKTVRARQVKPRPALRTAIRMTLGEEALRFEPERPPRS